jgi:hypothetical protein
VGRHRPRDRCTGDRRRRSRRPRPGAQPELTPTYQFRTIDNDNDPTFNQLLGINQRGLIAGYFGSGAQGHPDQGYLLSAHHGQAHYVSENWPESTQTQVTGLNDRGTTVGFWSSANNANMATNDNRAVVTDNGYFIDGDYPATTPAAPPVDQLLGVNDHNVAVGFYTDAAANTHAYSFDIRHNSFKEITPVGITNPTASAINNQGDVAGFGTSNGQVVGYLLSRDGSVTTLNVPGSSMTQAIGIAHRNARETGPPAGGPVSQGRTDVRWRARAMSGALQAPAPST